jgi:hypothetical protein
MGVGTCLLLLTAGAGICFSSDVSGMAAPTIGFALMIAGVVGLLLSQMGVGARTGRPRSD